MNPDASDDGERLARQARWLDLLFVHLVGPRVRARVDREDLVQEVFLRVLASPAPLPPDEAALRRLLATVAKRCVFDVLRALRARKRDARELPIQRSEYSRGGPRESELARTVTGPLTRMARDERRRELAAAFASLSAEHRRVLGLRQLEGLSAAEAGRRMGRSEAAVHSLFRRALQAWDRAAGGAE